jgi:pimeloyl-ACP methyl ester carboxylesterase
MWCNLAVVVGGMILGHSGEVSSGGPREFEAWFHQAVDGDLEIPKPIEQRAKGFRYVFVSGFRNERMPGYFVQNKAELRALGVPRSRIHVINPSSRQDSEANAVEVKAQFQEIAVEGPERLVVIAHSRGACDALAFALGNPKFVEDHVEALFLIQGPFGGSGVAEFLVGDGPKMDRRMPIQHRIVGNLLASLARRAIKKSGSDAVEGMTHETSKEFWAGILARHPEAVAIVSPKTFYVQAATDPWKLRLARRAVAWYLQIYHGRGDGVVSLTDQTLPGVGVVVATLQAGHADLTQKAPATRAPRSYRKALARAIFMAVGHSKGEPMATSKDLITSAMPGGRLDLGENTVPERQAGFEGLVRGKLRISPAARVVPADR